VYLEEPYKRRIDPPDPVGNRFPFTIPPPGATGIWAKYLPIAYSPGYNLHNKLPYAEHFNLTIQRAIAKRAVLSVGYGGSRGRHLLSTIESNSGNPANCLQILAALGQTDGCGPFGEDTI